MTTIKPQMDTTAAKGQVNSLMRWLTQRVPQETARVMNRARSRLNDAQGLFPGMLVGERRQAGGGVQIAKIRNHTKAFREAFSKIEKANPFKKMTGMVKELKNEMSSLRDAARRTAQDIKSKLYDPMKEGLKRSGGSMMRGGKKLGGLAKAGLGMGVGALTAFLFATHARGVANYEQQQQARLQALQTLGPNAKFAGGTSLGFRSPDAAQIQAQAGRSGFTGAGAGKRAMMAVRGFGQDMLGILGGVQARQNTNNSNAFRQVSAAIATGMETGLRRERITELLRSANSLAEDMVRRTPGFDGFADIVKELALLQSGGLKGRFAGTALQKANQAIVGASGAKQSFLLRAFGFGQGTNFLDALKMQERGITGGNLGAVMRQLQKEYGAGKDGGLSEAGIMGFKGLGLGSYHMASKFSKIYLEQKAGKLTKDEASKKIADLYDREKTSKMPKIQRDALLAMKNQGNVMSRIANRFQRLANVGRKNYNIVQALDKVHDKLVNSVKPIMKAVSDTLPGLVKSLTDGGFFKTIAGLMRKLAKGISLMASMIGGFMKGVMKGSGFMDSLSKGMSHSMMAMMNNPFMKEQDAKNKATAPLADKKTVQAVKKAKSIEVKAGVHIRSQKTAPSVSKIRKDQKRKNKAGGNKGGKR